MKQSENSHSSHREAGIDVARGLCAVFVMYYHYRPSEFFRYGMYGVLLFFMISGYCMAPSLNSSVSLGVFLKKRLIRLFPALLMCAVISSVIEWTLPLRPDRAHGLVEFVGSVVCLPFIELPCRLLAVIDPRYFPHRLVDSAYWSLEIEIRFYILIGILYFLFKPKYFIRIFSIVTPVSVLCQAYWAQKYSFYVYLPAFLLGFGAFHFRRGDKRSAAVALVSVFVSCCLLWSRNVNTSSMPLSTGAGIVGFLSCGALLYFFSSPLLSAFVERMAAPRFSPARFLIFLGLISYPLYLLHQDVGYVLIELLSDVNKSLLTALFVPALVISAAWLVHKFFEFKAQIFLRKWLMAKKSGH